MIIEGELAFFSPHFYSVCVCAYNSARGVKGERERLQKICMLIYLLDLYIYKCVEYAKLMIIKNSYNC